MRRSFPSRSAPHRHRKPAPMPPETEEADELLLSAQAHDSHFLERTLRCEGNDLDRAMRLYHHSVIVRRLLPDLLAPGRERAAIPLREDGPAPHVIVTREGAFVTCLAEHMGIGDLPTVPFSRFAAAMDQADAAVERSRVRHKQLQALPWQELYTALLRGPGCVTREMIEVLDRDPETYDFVVAKVFIKEYEFLRLHWKATSRANHSPRRMEIEATRSSDRLQLCTYLLAHMHKPYILDMLCWLLPVHSGLEACLGAAIARHPDGGDRILQLLEEGKADARGEQTIAPCLTGHCMLYLERAHAIATRFRRLPLRRDGWEAVRCVLDTFLKVPEEVLRLRAQDVKKMQVPVEPPTGPAWLFGDGQLITESCWPRRPSQYFPPAAEAEAVKAAWDERLRAAKEWDGFQSERPPVVRQGPRIGRNDPCPCGSGRKHKQCCLGKPAGPSAEELAAQAAQARREAFVAEVTGQPARQPADVADV